MEEVTQLEPLQRQAHTDGENADGAKSQGSVPVLKGEVVLPGLRVFKGRSSDGVEEVKDVIGLLNAVDIPACIVDVNALRYYGAGRVTWVGHPHFTCCFLSI